MSSANDPPYPSAADVFYLSYFPAVYVGLVLLCRAAVPRFYLSMWLDTVVGALGAAALAYTLAFEKLIDLSGGRLAVVLTNLAYPTGDLLMLAVAAGLVAAIGWRCGRGWVLLIAGLLIVAVADTVYSLQVSAGSYVQGGLEDVLWPLSSVLAAWAALSPPVSRSSSAGNDAAQSWWSALLGPAFFTLSSVVLLAVAQRPTIGGALAAASILVAGGRAALTFREVSGLAETRQQALTDELTGLANRRAFNTGLSRALERRRPDQSLAVLLIDLDRFKEVNDALGHHVGDELLRLVGPRIGSCLRQEDILARLGGDEFAIVLSERADPEAASAVARRITEALTAPFALTQITLHVGASIGIASCPLHSAEASILIR